MADEILSDTVRIHTTQPTEDDSRAETSLGEEDPVPEGTTYHFNSKKIVVSQLRRLASMLELSTDGTAATLRQTIEGKLMELGHEPRNTQVVVANTDSRLYLVDASGIIREEPEHVSLDNRVDSHVNTRVTSNNNETDDAIDTLRRELREARLEIEGLRNEIRTRDEALVGLRTEVEALQTTVRVQTTKAKRLWAQKCEQLLAHETILEEKDAEIARLQEQLSDHTAQHMDAELQSTCSTDIHSLPEAGSFQGRRGKAPPVDPFKGNDPEVTFDDWLPTLDRAARWNGWSEEEKLMQLAGHLRGKAAREYGLLSSAEKQSFDTAVPALRTRLDPGSCALAAQDFRNAIQREKESVSDYITRLERSFQIAYGRELLTTETRDAFLYSQLQAGLKLTLMESPAVSGSLSYKQLCVAAKQEEKRLLELQRRRQHQERQVRNRPTSDTQSGSQSGKNTNAIGCSTGKPPRECYVCGSTDHLAKHCKQRRGESTADNKKKKDKGTVAATKSIRSTGKQETSNPLNFLYSDSDTDSSDASVNIVRITDQGSQLRKVRVEIAGVPATGFVDTGADITIMGSDLFKKVAAVAGLKKKQFKPADKIPHTYDRRHFKLDGRLDLDVSFNDKTMHTAVYVKMDAYDNLLLSEGVCQQLGIVTYHPQVEGSPSNATMKKSSSSARSVRVCLVDSVRLTSRTCAIVSGKLETCALNGPLLLEQTCCLAEQGYDGLEVGESLVDTSRRGYVKFLLSNPTGVTHKLGKGTWVGIASEAEPVESVANKSGTQPQETVDSIAADTSLVNVPTPPVCSVTTTDVDKRMQKLIQSVAEIGINLPWQDKSKLYSLLCEYHDSFVLEDGERGETGLVQMKIDTGHAIPKRQSVRRTPFAAREEIAKQLQDMQDQNIIYPSDSPWASPVVLVRKKDGSLRFCIDYRNLNSATKSDPFPLPRIDDLLDQLGNAKYFSTLDLATGYWQVQMHPESREKTAFVTHQGLYEFRVMPFGLKNAPAVFQRLMQKVLMGLNSEEGHDYVAIYLDDVLVFSETLEMHLTHVRKVLERFKAAGLKLKPSKCHFISQSVHYLGHLITPQGISPNPDRVSAIKDFPVPHSVKEVRQFLGLASYYRRFISSFAKLAQPLHCLTQKNAVFRWSPDCQQAFQQLKDALVTSPVLAYPNFSKSFTLETDASIKGLGAVLSQRQDDTCLHPVAYASRSLAGAEKRYAITELETLAVVWAVSHFHAYLYGNDVTVLTDHSAVKAVLETPSPSAKHARWWSKVYGCGVRNIQIVYRPGKENPNADALSRNPQGRPVETLQDEEVQVATLQTPMMAADLDIHSLLTKECLSTDDACAVDKDLGLAQREDPDFQDLIHFLTNDKLPVDPTHARKVAAQAPSFTLVNDILYFVDSKNNHYKRCAVPRQLRPQLIEENHSGPMAGHFSADKLYKALIRHWWWPGMFADVTKHCSSCPQCAIVNGAGRVNRPPYIPSQYRSHFKS